MSSPRDDEFSVIAADDELLSALGRGEPAPDDDKLAGLLATWRSDLDEPGDFDVTAILDELAEEPGPLRPAVPEERDTPVPSTRSRRWRPGRVYLTGIAAALLLLAGLGVGAGTAGPDSPLWPIARVLYPERSDVRLTEHTIALAREAASDGRYDDARRSLDRAAGSVGRIDDEKLAGKLRAEIDQIRRDLPPVAPAPVVPSPSVSVPSVPVPSAAQPNPTAGGEQGGPTEGPPQQPGGGETRPPGGIIPGLPTPTLPIPLPTLTIPGLPLGTAPPR